MMPPRQRPRERHSLGEIVDAEEEARSSASGEHAEMLGDPPPPPVKVVNCERRRPRGSPPDPKRRSAPPAPRDPQLPRSSDPFSFGRLLEESERDERLRLHARPWPEEWVDYKCCRSQMTSSQRRGLWTQSRAWGLKFGLDSNDNQTEMKLYPMIMHSVYLIERFEGLSPRSHEHRNSEIDIPDYSCHPLVLRLADSHCTGVLKDRECSGLSNETLLSLVSVSRFLKMDCLFSRASFFLDDRLRSQEGCCNLLKAFNASDMAEEGEHHDRYEKCMALLRHKMLERYNSNLESMVCVATLLPQHEAEKFFQSCRDNWCGLYHKIRLDYEDNDYEFSLVSHATCDGSVNRRIRDSYIFKPCPWGCGQVASAIDHRLSSISDLDRRGQLVLSLAKGLIGTRLKKSQDEIHLGTTRVSWDFLCVLLKQAGDCLQNKSMFGVTFPDPHFTRVSHDEISHMEWMMATCLSSSANSWLWIKYGRTENAALWALQMLHFESLLGVVKQTSLLYPSNDIMPYITMAVDVTVGDKLSSGDLTVGEALTIYRSFLNGTRTSHLEIFQVFEPQLQGQAMSVRELAELSSLLNIDKIPYAVVELLAHTFSVICNSDEKLLELCSLLDREALPPILEKIAQDLRLAHDLSVKFMSKECQLQLCSLLSKQGDPDDEFYKLFDKMIDNLKEGRSSYVLFNTFWNRKIYDPALRAEAKEELMNFQLELGLGIQRLGYIIPGEERKDS